MEPQFLKRPDWPGLQELAASQAGYFDIRQAADLGFSQPLLQHHLGRGRLERRLRGIYRLSFFPPSDEEDFVVAWLWSSREGILSHETALFAHRLGDALPAQQHITVPTSWRSRRRLVVPPNIRLHYGDILSAEKTWFGAAPITTVERTLRDCIADRVSPELIHQAMADARRRGLLEQEILDSLERESSEQGSSA